MEFCNENRDLVDTTKRWEIRRIRYEEEGDAQEDSPLNGGLTPKQDEAMDQLETEQVAWIWCIIFAFAAPEAMSFLRSARKVFIKKSASEKKLVGTHDYKTKTRGVTAHCY